MKDSVAKEFQLSPVSIRDGVWEGLLSGGATNDQAPAIDVHHLGERVASARVTQSGDGTWTVQAEIPRETLHDGVQTYALVDQATGTLLSSFAVSLGEALDPDLRAEVELLRAELDLLKRAFRRHCSES